MANDTPNHGYNTPAAGTEDWHIPVNATFENLEVDVELRDTETNIGNRTPHDGAKLLTVDTGKVFLGDGENWNDTFRLPEVGVAGSGQVFSHDGDSLGYHDAGTLGIATRSWVQSTAKAADADKFDGVDSSNYARTDIMETFTSGVDIRGGAVLHTDGSGTDSLKLTDSANGQEILVGSEGGDVDIPNGSLSVGDLSVLQNGNILGFNIAAGDTIRAPQIQTDNSGSGSVVLRDRANGQNILEANEGGDVSIPNGPLSLGGNNITNVGNMFAASGNVRWGTAGGGSDFVRITDESDGSNIAVFNEGGDVEIPNGDLTLSSGVLNATGGLFVSTGDINLNERGIISSEWDINPTAGSNMLFQPGSAGSFVRVQDASLNPVFTVEEGGQVSVDSGDLDVSGSVTSNGVVSSGIIKLKNGSHLGGTWGGDDTWHTAGSGNSRVSLFDDANSQPILEAHEGGDVEVPNGNLNLSGNNLNEAGIVRPQQLDIQGGTLNIFDTTNLQQVFEAHEGGDVNIPNGDLNLGGDVSFSGAGAFSTEGERQLRLSKNVGPSLRVKATHGNGGYFWDEDNSQMILSAESGGNVSIPNGRLDVSDAISSVGNVDSGGDEWILETVQFSNGVFVTNHKNIGTGTNVGRIRYDGNGVKIKDATNNQSILEANIGGNVTIPNGDLDMGASNIDSVRSIYSHADGFMNLLTNGSGSGRVRIKDQANGIDIAEFAEGGDVEIPNGNLTVGNNINLSEGIINGVSWVDYNDAEGDGTYWRVAEHGSGQGRLFWQLRDGDGPVEEVFNLQKTGNVEIPDGSLTVAEGTTYEPQTTPAAPSSGWTAFTDSADGALKAVKSDGTVVELTQSQISALGEIGDVDTSGADAGDPLEYNGSTWVAGTDDSGSSGVSSGEANTWTAVQTFSAGLTTKAPVAMTMEHDASTTNWMFYQPGEYISVVPSSTPGGTDWDYDNEIKFRKGELDVEGNIKMDGGDVAPKPWVNDNFASAGHNHDGTYAVTGHTHDTRYYTQGQVDSFLSGKSDTGHSHGSGDLPGTLAYRDEDQTWTGVNTFDNSISLGGTSVTDVDSILPGGSNSLNIIGVQAGGKWAFQDSNDNYVAQFEDGGNVHIGGELHESGNRVATRTWANSNFASAGHTHDDRYYTESEADSNFAGSGHLHDSRYSQLGHSHTEGDLPSNVGYTDTDQTWSGVQTFDGSVDFSGTSIMNVDGIIGGGPNALNIFSIQSGGKWAFQDADGNNVLEVSDAGWTSATGTLYAEGDVVATRPWANGRFSELGHLHDTRYYTQAQADSNFAASGHLHDGRYYTQSEADSNFAVAGHNHDGTYAPATHNHDSRYYTESEIDSQLSGKSNTGHTHSGYLSSTSNDKTTGNIYIDNHGFGGSVGSMALAVGDPDTGLDATTDGELRFQSDGTLRATMDNKFDFKDVPTVNGANLARENWVSSNYASDSHNHDGRYYTKSESDANLSTKYGFGDTATLGGLSVTHNGSSISRNGALHVVAPNATGSTGLIVDGDSETDDILLTARSASNGGSTHSQAAEKFTVMGDGQLVNKGGGANIVTGQNGTSYEVQVDETNKVINFVTQ